MNPRQLVKTLISKPLDYFGYKILRKPKYLQLNVSYGWIAHFLYFKEIYDLVKDLKGDIVECGVGYGHSFFKLCCLAYYENKGRKVYGFDSFQGFPEPSNEDRSPRNPQKGDWDVATVETIEKLLIEAGRIDSQFVDNNVKLVKGFFEESLNMFGGESIAILHLDVDLYKSYKVALEYFWPMVEKGGVVLFDEYKQPEVMKYFPGASKAIDEFFGSLVNQIQYNKNVNRYYIVKQ